MQEVTITLYTIDFHSCRTCYDTGNYPIVRDGETSWYWCSCNLGHIMRVETCNDPDVIREACAMGFPVITTSKFDTLSRFLEVEYKRKSLQVWKTL